MSIRVIVADDHAVFRAGIIALLEKETDLKVVGETGTGPETLDLVQKQDFDVLTLDLSMPESDGSKLSKAILQIRPRSAIVVLTMHEDPYYLHELLKAGAKGFVVKKSTGTCLLEAIRAARKGQCYVDPSLAGSVLAPQSTGQAARLVVTKYTENNPAQMLTPREREVCGLLALGHTNAEVAQLLFISGRTVETHRNNIMEKLNLKTRAELVRYAMNYGLLISVK